MTEILFLELPAIQGVVLGVKVFRGFAKLSDLARISKADIFDQMDNPLGTQRELNLKHAKDAYTYVKEKDLAFWPEVFLCAREKDVIKFVPFHDESNFGKLIINLDLALKEKPIAISRVDGNHRLYYADGRNSKFPVIEKTVSFCMAYDLTFEQEISLFIDINDNQKKMNTNHLANVEVRLTPEQELKLKSPELYIAHQLGEDPKSPIANRVNYGVKNNDIFDIQLGALKTGIEYMISRSTQLPLHEVDVQYRLIRNFLSAVKKWQPEAWSKPKDFIMLRGVGLWAICFLGATVIDRVLLQDEFNSDQMYQILSSSNVQWDWSRNGSFKGISGRDGALEISKKIVRSFYDPNRPSSMELYQRIMEQD